MRILQDGKELGRVQHFRMMRTQGTLRCIFEVRGDTAVALDTDRSAVLVDSGGKEMVLQPTKSFYSWGAFRVHGVIVEEDAE